MNLLETSLEIDSARRTNLHDILYLEIVPEISSGKVGEVLSMIAKRHDLSDVEKVYCAYKLAQDVENKKRKGIIQRITG